MVEEYEYPFATVVVDSIDSKNNFTEIFSAWPERYVIVKNNRIIHLSNPTTEYGFDRLLLRRKLRLACLPDEPDLKDDNEEEDAAEVDALKKSGDVVHSDRPVGADANHIDLTSAVETLRASGAF
mmetsp:Transcript_29093/g.81430  ORF Transcript_29093/g.81430 Transcript_29093/m.81430 type:complete len:125 (+) Transcript_29093:707-1081(+)